jgi:LysM repeat protein
MAYEVVYTVKEFHDLLLHIATELPTKYQNKYPYNLGYYHTENGGYWSWDCWNLIKSIIWGWKEKREAGYYAKRNDKTGLGDWNGATILSKCTEVSSDFSKVPIGAFLLSPDAGHAGIYVGEKIINSKCYNVVECTPKWKGGVQLSYVTANGKRYNYKDGSLASVGWGKHGKLPWIDYSEQPEPPAPPTPPTPTPEENVYYTVKRGDNLTRIAAMYNTTISQIVAWNQIKNPNLIYVGQKLIVGKKSVDPSPTPTPPQPTPEPEKVYYVVKRGDNLSRIAKKYGTTVDQLLKWNPIKNKNLIYVGQVIRVK